MVKAREQTLSSPAAPCSETHLRGQRALTRGEEEERPDLDFYRQHTAISSPGRYVHLFAGLPADLCGLCCSVQNALLHPAWIRGSVYYGITIAALKRSARNINDELNLRTVEDMLGFLARLDKRPLVLAREPQSRAVGNCRHYALLLVSMLRHQGVPARVRSGVARYFYPHGRTWVDHFVCEMWNTAEERWQRVDAEVDSVHCQVLRLSLDPTDLPRGEFMDAGETYVLFQQGHIEPRRIGIEDFRGDDYVRFKLLSDLACVCGVEVLPWESWGTCADVERERLVEGDLDLLEQVAELLEALSRDPGPFGWALQLLHEHPRLRMPAGYRPGRWESPEFN